MSQSEQSTHGGHCESVTEILRPVENESILTRTVADTDETLGVSKAKSPRAKADGKDLWRSAAPTTSVNRFTKLP